MSFISAGGDLTPNGIELVGDDLTCVDFARRRLRGRRFDPDSTKLQRKQMAGVNPGGISRSNIGIN